VESLSLIFFRSALQTAQDRIHMFVAPSHTDCAKGTKIVSLAPLDHRIINA